MIIFHFILHSWLIWLIIHLAWLDMREPLINTLLWSCTCSCTLWCMRLSFLYVYKTTLMSDIDSSYVTLLYSQINLTISVIFLWSISFCVLSLSNTSRVLKAWVHLYLVPQWFSAFIHFTCLSTVANLCCYIYNYNEQWRTFVIMSYDL